MKFLNMLKKQPNLSEEVLMYIAEYKMIYRWVIREAETRENGKYILNAENKSGAVWQIINKGMRTTPSNKRDSK